MLKKGTIAVCEQCGFEWIPKVDSPERCPSRKCRSRAWNLGNGGRGEPAGWEQKKADPQRSKAVVLDAPPLGKERPSELSVVDRYAAWEKEQKAIRDEEAQTKARKL